MRRNNLVLFIVVYIIWGSSVVYICLCIWGSKPHLSRLSGVLVGVWGSNFIGKETWRQGRNRKGGEDPPFLHVADRDSALRRADILRLLAPLRPERDQACRREQRQQVGDALPSDANPQAPDGAHPSDHAVLRDGSDVAVSHLLAQPNYMGRDRAPDERRVAFGRTVNGGQ